MKKYLSALAIILLATTTQAFEIKDKLITVTSNATLLVIPDEIELEITLEEPNGNSYIEKVEEAFWTTLEAHKVAKSHLVKENVNVMYYWYYWWKTRDSQKKSKKIVLKLSAKTNFLRLVKALDKDWVKDVKIIGISNKNMDQHVKYVQIKAMKKAKSKATYLLSSVGEEIGGVVSVVELKTAKNNPNHAMQIENVKYSSGSYRKIGGSHFENIPELSLTYTVKSQFKIK